MSTPGCSPLVTRFDVFEVDLRAGELHKAGRKIKLQVLPFQALALLLERQIYNACCGHPQGFQV